MQLTPGDNLIGVQAVTADGILSEPVTVKVSCGRTPEAGQGMIHVLAIGVSQHRDSKLNLAFADKDARDFVTTMQRQKGRQFSDVHATLLVNDQATRENVREQLKKMRALKMSPQDHVVLYLSGHGGKDELGAYCFVTANADVTQLGETGVPWTELRDSVADCPGRAFIFLDSSQATFGLPW